MATDKKNDGRTVIIKGVRLSFADGLVEAKPTVVDGPPKHTCNFILETDRPETAANKKLILSAIEAACEKEFKKADRYKSIMEDDPKRLCYRRGSLFKSQETGEIYAGYENNFAISAAGPSAGKKRPVILDRKKNKITEVSRIGEVAYGGCYADVRLSFYGTKKGGPGVFATIDIIRSWQEGEPMGGGYVYNEGDKDDFDDLGDLQPDAFDDADADAAADEEDLFG